MKNPWVSRITFLDITPPMGEHVRVTVVFTVEERQRNHNVEVDVLLDADDSATIATMKERAIAKSREVLETARALK
jgi:hypothetical protein